MKSEIIEPDEYFLIGQNDPHRTIYLRYPLFTALEDFAKHEGLGEQVGLLVGREVAQEDDSILLIVEDAIEVPVGEAENGHFDEGLWRRARRIAAARHPSRVVVGWFSTHLNGELAVTDEEQNIHRRFFPEENHLLYVICSKGQDRNFFYRLDGELSPAEGFRIYGKTPADMGDEQIPEGASPLSAGGVEASPVQQARHLERTMEKVLNRLKHPPISTKDIVIIGLLVLNALLIWFRPNPPVNVDTSALERGQSQISAEISTVRDRIQKLEDGLSDVKLIDEQLRLAAGLEEIDDLDEIDDTEPSTSTAATVGVRTSELLQNGGGTVELHVVEPGDTLGMLVDHFYPDSSGGTTRLFAEFNRLKGPDYAIFPGDTLKVPPLEMLQSP